MNTYDIGDLIRMRATFTNSAGAVVDPSSVSLQYRALAFDPASVTTLIFGVNSIVKASTGDYYHDYSATSSAGEWRFRWNGTGANAAAAEDSIKLRERYVG